MTALHIVGVGNPWRSDDSVGLQVIDALIACGAGSDSVTLRKSDGDVADLIDVFQVSEEVVLVDAMNAGDELTAGEVQVFDVSRDTVPAEQLRTSTHALGVLEAIELARVLNCLPARVTVWGITGQCFEMGDALSAAVADAVQPVAARIRQTHVEPGDA